MILFGNFENNNYVDEKFSFKLDFEFNAPWFVEFDNDNLIDEANSCIAGFYHLEIEKDGKVIYETDGNCVGDFHPVEILQLIDQNKNWSIKLDELVGNDSNDILPFINTVYIVLDEDYNIDNVNPFDSKYHDEIVEYNQDLLRIIGCGSSFFNSWQELELNFCYDQYIEDDLIVDYAKSFVDDVILKNRM